MTGPATAVLDRPAAGTGYPQRVREVIGARRGELAAWEDGGHLPRDLFTDLGSAGAFRERWASGAAAGLPLAGELVGELAPLSGGVALAVSIHSEVFVHALHRFGGPQQAPVLEAALAGEVVGCVAFTEPDGGSDLYSLRTTGSREGGSWRVRGTKRYTTNVGTATHVLLLARTQDQGPGHTLFLVALDRPGVRVTRFFDTFGMRCADTGELVVDLELSDADVVGRPHAGLLYALKLLDYERMAACRALVAGARTGLTLATQYLRERKQFGARLFDHQALAHRLADRWADLAAAEALADKACRDARGDHLPHHLVAAAKLVAGRAGLAALDDAMQFLGGRGYTTDFPLERMYRDGRLVRIGGGTDEMLRQIIAMHLDVPDTRARAVLDRLIAHHEETSA